MNYATFQAYANGALDGYNTGTENNPYDPEINANLHQAYKLGYDYGVAKYCQDNIDEDNYYIEIDSISHINEQEQTA